MKNKLNEVSLKLARDWSRAAFSGRVDSTPLENGTAVAVGTPAQKLPFGEMPPISFVMEGHSSAEVLTRSRFAEERLPAGDGFSRKKAVWDDPVTNLAVAVEVMEFTDFPAVEYVLRLKNNGRVNTPIIENILSADFSWPAAGTPPPMLYRSRGSKGIKRYVIEDADTGEKQEVGGDILLAKGLLVQIPKPRESRLFFLQTL